MNSALRLAQWSNSVRVHAEEVFVFIDEVLNVRHSFIRNFGAKGIRKRKRISIPQGSWPNSLQSGDDWFRPLNR
jgi:hypothetical protein